MEVLYFTIIITFLFSLFFIILFALNVKSGQLENLEIEGQKILIEDKEIKEIQNESETRKF
jgi:nitrogen fixation-related uncharacterized protein